MWSFIYNNIVKSGVMDVLENISLVYVFKCYSCFFFLGGSLVCWNGYVFFLVYNFIESSYYWF